MNYVRKLLN